MAGNQKTQKTRLAMAGNHKTQKTRLAAEPETKKPQKKPVWETNKPLIPRLAATGKILF